MNSGHVIGLCIFVGMACGWFDNRLDRIAERISGVDRRIALLAEELGDKKPDEGGDDSVYGRSERREEKTPEASDPAPEGAGFKRLAPRLRDDDGEQFGVVPVDLLVEEAPFNEVHHLGGRRIVQGIVVHDGGGQDAPENFAGRFVHAEDSTTSAQKGGAE